MAQHETTSSGPLRPVEFVRILVALDFTQDCRLEIECAATLAKDAGAVVTLLHVCAPEPELGSIVPGSDSAKDGAEERRLVLPQLEEWRKRLLERGIADIRIEVETGDATEILATRASNGACDLVVVGTHGRRGAARLFWGSVAESVTRRARCPVLTVHLPPA